MNGEFKKLFEKQGIDCSDMVKIEGGTSNDTYLIKNAIVYREKKPSDPRFYHPVMEERALLYGVGKGIAPPVLYFDERSGDYAMLFIPGGRHFPLTGATKEDILKAVATIKSFHDGQVSLPPFDMDRRLAYYQDEAGVRGVFPGEEEAIARGLSYLKDSTLVPSHNDLVGSNILYFNDTALLIDYEFAGYNDPYFDLASLLSENQIEDRELQSEALYALFGMDADLKKLDAFLAYEDILWGYWALYRKKMTGNEVFQRIFESKKKAYSRRESFAHEA